MYTRGTVIPSILSTTIQEMGAGRLSILKKWSAEKKAAAEERKLICLTESKEPYQSIKKEN